MTKIKKTNYALQKRFFICIANCNTSKGSINLKLSGKNLNVFKAIGSRDLFISKIILKMFYFI